MKICITDAIEEVEILVRQVANTSKTSLKVLNSNPSCKPGCSHCCNRLIYITLAEAFVIQKYLKSQKKWNTVLERAVEMEPLSRKVDSITWFMMKQECPVLNPETKMCEAYEVRPPACSTHFVSSDPSSCDPWSMDQQNFIPIDMEDEFSDFLKVIEMKFGRGSLSIPLPITTALRISESLQVRDGLTVDEILTLMAREFLWVNAYTVITMGLKELKLRNL